MKNQTIGDRMKANYESRSQTKLIRRMPVIIRLDGKAFHTFTRGFEKPYSPKLHRLMKETGLALIEQIQGAKLAYIQSDEISLLLTDYENFATESWFDYNAQKLTSVSASIATATFNKLYGGDKLALFDSRCFNVPKEDVNNYFLWRQQDWIRNSKQMWGESWLGKKNLHKKSTKDIVEEVTKDHGVDWNTIGDNWRLGTTVIKNGVGVCDFKEGDMIQSLIELEDSK